VIDKLTAILRSLEMHICRLEVKVKWKEKSKEDDPRSSVKIGLHHREQRIHRPLSPVELHVSDCSKPLNQESAMAYHFIMENHEIEDGAKLLKSNRRTSQIE
jgi:hypothetical protein